MGKSLGRGLDALVQNTPTASENIPIELIDSNPYQPRGSVTDDTVTELAESLRKSGLLQPVVVRRKADRYEVIAGERRLRAARLAGFRAVPAVVRNVTDRDMLGLALVENLQREDLSPIERARAFKRLQDEFGMSHDEIASAVGKSRPAVTNTLRLLELSEEIQELVSRGTLSEGHARALVGLSPEEQMELTRKTIERGLSVRDVEKIVRSKRRRGSRRPPTVVSLEQYLREYLGTRVDITVRGETGKVIIYFYSAEHLENLIHTLVGERSDL